MSFISDELANVLKSVYMKEESGKVEDVNSSIKLDKDEVDIPKVEKRSRKHKHKKHSSKSKSRDKKKHKKRKHKSRSRSSSESRSRSRSRSTEQENSKPQKSRPLSSRSKSPDEIDQADFVLQKERADEDDKHLSSDKERNNLKSKEAFETVFSSSDRGFQEKCKEVAVSESKTLEDQNQGGNAESVDDKTLNLHNLSPASKKEKERSSSSGKSEEKVTQSKQKNSPSHSRGKSRSPDDKSSQTLKQRQSRSHSRDQHIAKKVRSCSKESVHRKTSRSRSSSRNKKKAKSHSRSSSRSKSRSRSPSRNKSAKRRKSKSRSHSTGKNRNRSGSRSRSRSHSHSKSRKSRSRSKQRSTKQKRTKSRSHSKERNRKRSLPKSRSRSHSRSKSRSRSRSPRHKRTRSRSRRRSPVFRNFRRFSPPHWRRGSGSFRRRSRSTSRSRRSSSRRRSYSRRRDSRSRSDSRSKSRQKSGRRSRSRSRVRRSRSRSHVRNRKSRSVSKGKRRRSRSLSHSKGKGRRSTSRDRNRTRSRSKSKSKDQTQTVGVLLNPKTNTATANNVSSATDKPVTTTLSSQQVKVAQKAGGKTIAELTAFCKKLQEEKEDGENVKSEDGSKVDEEQTQTVTHHPFLVKEKPDITIPPVIFPVNMNKPSLPAVDPNKPLQEQFPVSCGSKHREKEHVNDGAGIVADVDGSANQQQQINEVFAPPITEKLDISELVGKRMEAQRRLQSDPNDIEALLTLQEIQMKMQNWCQSNVKPGQFTGELVKNLLPKEDLQGGFQAWAKKDMFHNLTPVSGGIGMKLLRKMGWKPGQVIGKRGEGYAEPIALTVKIDRKGLSAGKEKAAKKSTPAVLDLQGKHPVSALAEYCSKRKWQLPDYSLIFDHGPAHHKQFLFKVLVNGTEYQPAVVCGNKKQAKAQAAIFALKGLGLIPEDADMSAV